MFEEIGALDILDKGIRFSNTGIGNNVIDMINAPDGGFFDSVKGRVLNTGVILHHDNATTFARG
jgi:hypothetical protein